MKTLTSQSGGGARLSGNKKPSGSERARVWLSKQAEKRQTRQEGISFASLQARHICLFHDILFQQPRGRRHLSPCRRLHLLLHIYNRGAGFHTGSKSGVVYHPFVFLCRDELCVAEVKKKNENITRSLLVVGIKEQTLYSDSSCHRDGTNKQKKTS